MSLKACFKKYLSDHFNPAQRKKIQRFLVNCRALGHGHDLTKLAQIFGTDKWGEHHYTPHYQTHFNRFKNKPIKLLEIGVGGDETPNVGGNSLRMWKKYFPHGQIFSLDIYDKSALSEKRITIFQGDQNNSVLLKKIYQTIGELDLIIDDGSHVNEHRLTSFQTLFPLLKDGGIYIMEDLQTSYWPKFNGDSENLNNPANTTTFLKQLTDGLNYREIDSPNYTPDYFAQNITSIHFYHNLVFIYKSKNID